jgi:hypothetical protein
METWKADIEALLRAEDHAGLVGIARNAAGRTLRYLSGSLLSEDEEVKWRAVRALGALAADPGLLSDRRLSEQLRRYLWSLNDESGAVPFGVPEAMGEVLARRPSLQKAFLPLVCAMIHQEEASQTGPIERGIVWAIGRVGEPAAQCDAEVLPRIRGMAAEHPDAATRRVAAWAADRLEGGEAADSLIADLIPARPRRHRKRKPKPVVEATAASGEAPPEESRSSG